MKHELIIPSSSDDSNRLVSIPIRKEFDSIICNMNKPNEVYTQSITYDNGDCYEGEMIDGKRNGKGACKYRNNEKYIGIIMNSYMYLNVFMNILI